MKKCLISLILVCFLITNLFPSFVYAAGKTVSSEAIEDFVKTAESKEKSGKFPGLPGDSSTPWCGYFVGWALDNSKVSEETGKSYANCGGSCDPMVDLAIQGYGTIYIPTYNKTKPFSNTYVGKFIDREHVPESKIKKVSSFTPQRGDLVLYNWTWKGGGYFDHIGIMTSESTTIEGNTSAIIDGEYYSSAVARKSLNDPADDSGTRGDYICAYFRFNSDDSPIDNRPGPFPTETEYFNCDVKISCIKGKRVNLYKSPDAFSAVSYFSKGQVAYSTYGAKCSDGSTWYRIAAESSTTHQVENYWLKRDDSKMTVTDLSAPRPGPTSISMKLDTSSVSLSLPGNDTQTVTLTVSGADGSKYQIVKSNSNSAVATSETESQTGNEVFREKITARSTGTTTITYSLVEKSSRNTVKEVAVKVTVEKDQEISMSIDLPVVSLSLPNNNAQTVTLTVSGADGSKYQIVKSNSNSAVATSETESRTGNEVFCEKITAHRAGTTLIIYSLVDKSSGETVKETAVAVYVETGSTPIPEDAVSFNGHYYRIFDPGNNSDAGINNWEYALQFCQERGGHLATISDERENAFLYRYMQDAGYRSAYFGFSDAENEGNWQWCTNESVVYTNWAPGEPNNENRKEHYAMFYYKFSDGAWNDGDFGSSTENGGTAFICEWDCVWLDELQVESSDRYTGNMGDSFIEKIGTRNGTVDTAGNDYLHGLEAWIARWNYKNESSWAWCTYNLNSCYDTLSGTIGVLAGSYNKTSFHTTLEIWGDDTLLYSLVLLPDTPNQDVILDVAGVDTLKISLYDNTSASGGTSFALGNFRLYGG